MTISFYCQKLVHATEYHLQKKIANVIYGRILKQDDWIEITVVSPCKHRASFDLPKWGAKRRLSLNHTTAQTSGPVNLVVSLQTGFFECSIHLFEFIDKPMVTTKTAVAKLAHGYRPGFKTISQRHAAHVQQRSFSIHAESFQVCQNQASLIKRLLLARYVL